MNPDCEIHLFSLEYGDFAALDWSGTIYGYEGSTAQTYAEENGYRFALIGSEPAVEMGDINEDNTVNASDAAKILIAAAAAGAGGDYGLTDAQMAAADLNADGTVNASDAALVLIYAAYVGAGGTDSLSDFLKSR
ncbi:MAG: dockerin type I repeat-containing protein [Oscillospiraceae bacterium]|nr:dockerin type I repeat-containing protein [Oscillospiraceae bacterium]